jgi:di/tricarboxylate transporter
VKPSSLTCLGTDFRRDGHTACATHEWIQENHPDLGAVWRTFDGSWDAGPTLAARLYAACYGRLAAVALWMALWWITEARLFAVTALLPLVLFPSLGVGTIDETTTNYAHPLIFLFLGGFLMAQTIQRWGHFTLDEDRRRLNC